MLVAVLCNSWGLGGGEVLGGNSGRNFHAFSCCRHPVSSSGKVFVLYTFDRTENETFYKSHGAARIKDKVCVTCPRRSTHFPSTLSTAPTSGEPNTPPSCPPLSSVHLCDAVFSC